MKNALLVTLTVFAFSDCIFSQIEWVGNHDFSEKTTQLVKTNRNEYVLVGGSEDLDGYGFTVFDSMGMVKNIQYLFSYSNGSKWSEFIQLPDSTCVFAANWGECDVIVSALFKYNKNWQQEWQIYIDEFGEVSIGATDGAIIICGQYISAYSFNGDKIWQKDLNYVVSDITTAENDSLVLTSDNGLVIMDKDGNFARILPNLVCNRIEKTKNDHYWAQHGDTLSLLSPSFAELGFVHIPGETIKDFAFSAEEIAVLTQAAAIYRFDSAFQLINNFDLVGHQQEFQKVEYHTNGFLIAGAEEYGKSPSSNSSAFLKSYTVEGQSTNTNKDVGIQAVEVIGPPALTVTGWANFHTFDHIKVSVRNDGTLPVNRLNLNIRFPEVMISGWCPLIQEYTKAFENLSLDPGESVELVWEDFKVASSLFGQLPNPLSFCFWTSLPDRHLDINSDNDVFCTDYILDEKELVWIYEFEMMPNPASGRILIQYNLPETHAFTGDIYNHIGQCVKRFTIDQSNTLVNIEDLPKGIYFVSLLRERQIIATKKLIVQ